MRRQKRSSLVITSALCGAILSSGTGLAQSAPVPSHRVIHLTSQKIKLPTGTEVFAGGEATKLVNSQCLMCHSKDMITSQPPLNIETWRKEVDKMRTVYGCPLRAEQTAAIADFIFAATNASVHGER